MRTAVSLAAISILAVAAVAGQSGARQPAANASPSTARVGTMSELMIHIIYPTSDAVFYISSRTPTSDAEWTALQASTLTLAESANLLMMPGRTRAGQWNADSRMMLDAAWGAFKAAKVKDLEGVEAVSDQLYESCVSCHKAYRPDYGKPKPPPTSGR
jgi:cytochrome c556